MAPPKHAFGIEPRPESMLLLLLFFLGKPSISPGRHILEVKMHKENHTQIQSWWDPWEKKHIQLTGSVKIKPISPKYSLTSK